ncbi:MAG TPA: STN domain-containing protein [Cytophagaceae bacterium]
MRSIYILIMLLLCLNFSVFSQSGVLDKKVTVSYKEATVKEILNDINKKYAVNFSYADNKIPVNKKVSLELQDVSLNEVLSKIFAGTDITYKVVGKQIVLTQSASKKSTGKSKPDTSTNSSTSLNKEQVIEDTVAVNQTEEVNNEELKEEVYVSLDTTLKVNPKFQEYTIVKTEDPAELRKQYLSEKRKLREQYLDKLDSLNDANQMGKEDDINKNLKKILRELRDEVNALGDSISNLNIKKPNFLSRKSDNISVNDTTNQTQEDVENPELNEKDYTYVPMQVSIFPPLSSNGPANSKSVNGLSFNLFAGYAAGVQGAEFSSFLNVEKDFVKGAQFAAFGNIVGGDVRGVQGGGFMNINGGATQGAQMAGFMNISGDSVYAFQGAGFMNVAGGNVVGLQLAGFMNVNDGGMYGPQGAGFMNVVDGDMIGFQGAGFANIVNGRVSGFQGAGFMNVSENVNGVQASGFLNVAGKVKGSQLGILNIADTVTGIQLGFLSISKKGYYRFEVYTNETFVGNVAFKTGTKKLHNIFAASIHPNKDDYFKWAVGYGFGSEIKASNRLNVNIDVIGWHVNEGIVWKSKVNLLGQGRFLASFLIGEKTSLFVGPTFNVKVTDIKDAETFSPYISAFKTHTEEYNKVNVAMWPGFSAGIRF